jgi:putative ABC transport system ATP-binding protein
VTSTSVSAPPLLEAKGLTREFDDGQVQALRGVDFSIHDGEFIAITGPSECGKSTLLQLLGSLDRPTSGTLLYRGQSLPDHPNPAAYRACEIGFIFQAFHLLPTFTASENVQVPMFETDRSLAERRESRARTAQARRPRASARSFPFQALRRRTPAGRDRAQPGQRSVAPPR